MSKKVFLSLAIVISLFFVFSGCVSLPTTEAGEETCEATWNGIVWNGDFSCQTLEVETTFSATSNWFIHSENGASVTAIIENGRAEVTVVSMGENPWYSSLAQWIAPTSNVSYTLTFDASADTETNIGVAVAYYGTDHNWWYNPLSQTITLTPDSTSFTLNFDSHPTEDPLITGTCFVKFEFQFGNSATNSTIYIDNVSIVEN